MDLISLIILIVVIGVVLWAVNAYVPMQPGVKNLLNIVVVIALVLFLLSLFIGDLPSIRVGR